MARDKGRKQGKARDTCKQGHLRRIITFMTFMGIFLRYRAEYLMNGVREIPF